MMSRRWRWGGIGLGSGFYNYFAPTALGRDWFGIGVLQ
jgi:hypothetical protein